MIQIVPLKIQKENASDKEAYLKARCAKYEKVLKAGNPDRDKSQDDAVKQEILVRLLDLAEHGADPLALTPIDDAAAQENARFFKAEVDATFPLIEGETLIEEQVGQTGGRLYVKHVTNFSTLCFTDATAENPDEPMPLAVSPTSAACTAANDNAQQEAEALQETARTVLEIGQGLAELVPSPYDVVLSGAFKGLEAYLKLGSTSDVEKNTEKTINRIGELVGKLTWKASVMTTIKTQSGYIHGIIDGLKNTYAPKKKEATTEAERRELIVSWLTPSQRDLDKILGVLEEEDNNLASLPEYCLAAGAYLCVLQELASLDSKHKDDPFKSSYCVNIKEVSAPRFINQVNKVFSAIIARARESVPEGTEYVRILRTGRRVNTCPEHMVAKTHPTVHEGNDYLGAWYYDNASLDSTPNGFSDCIQCGHLNWAKDECSKARDAWIEGMQDKLVSKIYEDMGDLQRLANKEWTKLKDRPLYGAGHQD